MFKGMIIPIYEDVFGSRLSTLKLLDSMLSLLNFLYVFSYIESLSISPFCIISRNQLSGAILS